MYRRSNLIGSTSRRRIHNRRAPRLAQRGTPATNRSPALIELAKSQGIQLSYRDMDGAIKIAAREAVLAILDVMGLPVTTERSIREALREAHLRRWRDPLEPVVLVWDGEPTGVELRLPDGTQPDRYARVHLEDGSVRAFDLDSAQLRTENNALIEGQAFCVRKFNLPTLPYGYHQIELIIRGRVHRSLIIAAPKQAYSPPEASTNWGIFLPMYAAHSHRTWGAGNLNDWQNLTRWTAALGAKVVATLPLLAGFLSDPIWDPSPYAPVSRLFWNEFYLDLSRLPGFSRPTIQKLVDSVRLRKRIDEFRTSAFVDYRAEMKLKREVLQPMAQGFFGKQSALRDEFEDFRKQNQRLEDYAEFRAACEQLQKPWHKWEERLRRGKLQACDYAIEVKQYYLFSQWFAQRQFGEFADLCRKRDMKFHLDLPLGVHPDGYDAWRQGDSFAFPASVGAPPDLFFSKGQNWGFAPLNPQRLRQTYYSYVLAYLRFQMAHCQSLRIDHVMGLHRLYWIPPGFNARQGAYVNYPAEELYACLSLESHRHETLIVGENLGTVAPEVNRAMRRHRIRQTYVLQYEQNSGRRRPLAKPPRCSVATLNTHDTPTFTAHWHGLDIIERADLGLISKTDIKKELAARETVNSTLVAFLHRQKKLTGLSPAVHEVIKASLEWLAQSPAETLLINLEDLWQEERRQNTPGTAGPPNWRRKTRLTLEQICESPALRALLLEIDRARTCSSRRKEIPQPRKAELREPSIHLRQ